MVTRVASFLTLATFLHLCTCSSLFQPSSLSLDFSSIATLLYPAPSECGRAWQQVFHNFTTSVPVLYSTGKALNDLGDYDMCRIAPDLTYGTMAITYDDNDSRLWTGFCFPSNCTTQEFYYLADTINLLLEHTGLMAVPHVPERDAPTLAAGNEMGVFFFSFIICTMCFGIIIEYSTLFDKSEVEPNMPVEERKTGTGKFFLAFSITRNLNKLFNDPSPAKDTSLRIIDGIRVLTLFWVILVHGYTIVESTPVSNFQEVQMFYSEWIFAYVQGGIYAIDIFLFISAFLGTYLLLLRSGYGQPGPYKGINFLMLYFQRLYRLFPPMVLFIVFFMTFFRHFGNGPVWMTLATEDVDACKENWWSYFLFIGNIYPWMQMNRCLPWLFYVSLDFQFYLTLPLQIWVYTRNRKLGYLFASLILLGNMACVFVLSQVYQISIVKIGSSNYRDHIYTTPWSRIGPYQIGIIFGMMYFEWKSRGINEYLGSTLGAKFFKKVKNSLFLRTLLIFLGLVLQQTLIWTLQFEIRRRDMNNEDYDHGHFPQIFNNFFNALCRPLFALSLALIIMSPLTGHNKFLKFFLGSKGWVPWARLGYVAFLLHNMIFKFVYYQTRQGVYLNHRMIFWQFLGVLLVTYLLSIPFSITFELPFQEIYALRVWKKVDESRKSSSSANTQNNDSNSKNPHKPKLTISGMPKNSPFLGKRKLISKRIDMSGFKTDSSDGGFSRISKETKISAKEETKKDR